MKFNSLKDVLKFAINKELASSQFYTDVAARVKDQTTQVLFEVLSRNELQHKAVLEFEMHKLGLTTSSDIEMEMSQASLEMDSQAENMTGPDAIQVAIRKEKASFALYAELMALAKDPLMRKTFFELAQEEMRHMLMFEKEYDNIAPKR